MMIRRIQPQLAAAMMGKTPQFVRVGLQRGRLPFGTALKQKEGRFSKYSYYISPAKFLDYTGYTEEDVLAAAEKGGFSVC
jgi:hypothetical protein